MNKIRYLLVSCCLEPSRTKILYDVIDNLSNSMNDDDKCALTVFDNASTIPGVIDALKEKFADVYVSDKNVGYWTAVDWWLRHVEDDDPTYTYIIESDTMHYAFGRIRKCIDFLDRHNEIGAMRLHEYDYVNRWMYDKDRPTPMSRKSIWQSHINKATYKPVEFEATEYPDIFAATFLTQLPALNRYKTMVRVFKRLQEYSSFSELEFQKLYHVEYSVNSILDGGIFNADAASIGCAQGTVTGSWTESELLAKIGYQNTRQSRILSPSEYTVTKV